MNNISLKLIFFLLIKVIPVPLFSQWDLVYDNDKFFVTHLHFFNQDTGIVIGNNGYDTSWSARTVDGGMNWDTTRFCGLSFEKIFFPSKDTGFIVAKDTSNPNPGTIVLFRSVNEGVSWTLINDSIGTSAFVTMGFNNTQTGFIAADTLLWKTSDGGMNFTSVPNCPMSIYFDIDVSGDSAFFAGDSYYGYTYDLGSNYDTVKLYYPSFNYSINSYGDKIWFSGASNDGAFLFYPSSWYAKLITYDKSAASFSWIDFVNFDYIYHSEPTQNNIFLASYKSFDKKPILKSVDGGVTFYTQNTSQSGGWEYGSGNRIQCLNDTVCYLLSLKNIYKTTNGGGPLIELAGVNHISEIENFSVFPNPTTGNFTISLPANFNDGKLNVINSVGEIVLSKSIHFSNSLSIDISSQPKGIYFISLLTDNGIKSSKIILE